MRRPQDNQFLQDAMQALLEPVRLVSCMKLHDADLIIYHAGHLNYDAQTAFHRRSNDATLMCVWRHAGDAGFSARERENLR